MVRVIQPGYSGSRWPLSLAEAMKTLLGNLAQRWRERKAEIADRPDMERRKAAWTDRK